jgi:MFS family permease
LCASSAARIETVEDRLITFGSAAVGALIFAFTDSHWFNAIEAEVYAMSTLSTAIVAWLILHWAERADEPGNERYVLLISYVLGLATGIHLLNLLALPFMGMIIYFKKVKFSWHSFIIMGAITGGIFFGIYLGIIKGFPQIAAKIGLFGMAVVMVAVFSATVVAIIQKRRLASLILSSAVLVIVGYSTYGFFSSGPRKIRPLMKIILRQWSGPLYI